MINLGDAFDGAIDLQLLRTDNDVAAGFHISNGIYQSEVQVGVEDGSNKPIKQTIQMPVLDIHFHMANGKTTHRISISPDAILSLIAASSGWRLKLDQQQVASPPVPPTPTGPTE